MDNQDGAIREDVQDETGNEEDVIDQGERPLSPREEALARIEQANLDLIEKSNQEFARSNGAVPTPDEGRNQKPVEETAQTVKVKIDGEELELPISEVVKGYQKDQTASKRLEEAAARIREAEQREAQLAQLAAGKSEETPSLADEDLHLKAKRIIDSLMEGEADSAVESLAEILNAKSKAVDPPASVTDTVRQELERMELEREYEQARTVFLKDNADLNENPKLAAMVNDAYFRQLESGKRPLEASKAAAQEVRDFVQELTGRSGTGNSTNRQERKQSYDTITPASGRTEGATQQADESQAAVIAEMKRARGQG